MNKREKLILLLDKMINGVKVEIQPKERIDHYELYQNTGRWFDILSISNGKVTICSQNHFIINDLSIDCIKF